ncbi:hypothetical protein R50073_47730 [Maricurvus nonylphenolicus]
MSGLYSFAYAGSSAAASADKPLQFVAPAVERKRQAHFEHKYRTFHNAIMAQAGLTSELRFLPIFETQAQLVRREVDGQVGGICGVKRSSPTIDTLPYVSLARHLITAGDNPILSDLEDLRGKSLALIERYHYQLPADEALEQMGIRVHRVDAQVNNVAMLVSGRVDALLAPPPMVESIASHISPEARFNYAEAPFSVQTLCYVLPKTESGKQLAQRINQAIIELYQANHLQHFVMQPFQPPSWEALGLAKPD